MPIDLLSGYTFPIDQMPAPIQAVTLIVYARYYVTILRAVFLKGSPLRGSRRADPGARRLTRRSIIWIAARASASAWTRRSCSIASMSC